jgi:hypothetical protein
VTKGELRELLKEHLSIRIDEHSISYRGKGIKVSLWYDLEEISSDYVMVEDFKD